VYYLNNLVIYSKCPLNLADTIFHHSLVLTVFLTDFSQPFIFFKLVLNFFFSGLSTYFEIAFLCFITKISKSQKIKRIRFLTLLLPHLFLHTFALFLPASENKSGKYRPFFLSENLLNPINSKKVIHPEFLFLISKFSSQYNFEKSSSFIRCKNTLPSKWSFSCKTTLV